MFKHTSKIPLYTSFFYRQTTRRVAVVRRNASATVAPPPRRRVGAFRRLLQFGFGVVAATTAYTAYEYYLAKTDVDEHERQHHSFMVAFVSRLPLRALSELVGTLAECHVPPRLRRPIYGAYARVYGCKLEEASRALEDYECFGDFFARRLKANARTFDVASAERGDILPSPSDGFVLHFGELSEHNVIEQVKGVDFALDSFLGEEVSLVGGGGARRHLFFCTVYLSPGDYHWLHSPTLFTVRTRRHFPGHLFPVAPIVVENMRGVFALNERVALLGSWPHGFFSLTAVGATDVGNIHLPFDARLRTNTRPKPREPVYTRHYDRYADDDDLYLASVRDDASERAGGAAHRALQFGVGDELAAFRLGSTVVLVFEADASFRFEVSAGQAVRMGDVLGKLK